MSDPRTDPESSPVVDPDPDRPAPDGTGTSRPGDAPADGDGRDEVALDDPMPGDDASPAEGDAALPSVEDILGDLERVTAERDEYLGLAQSKQAELENMRKRMMKQQADEVARRSASIVERLLPVLDAVDYGVGHGDESLRPLQGQLLAVLGQEGLERVGETGSPFDPEQHEAVAHEPGDGGPQVVAEVMRAGYRWQGHLVRPAMVKVSG